MAGFLAGLRWNSAGSACRCERQVGHGNARNWKRGSSSYTASDRVDVFALHSGRLEGRPPGGDQEDVMIQSAIKIGVIAEQTGPLSFMGIADANVAKMVVDDINTSGGLLGRQLALCLEDGATIGSTYCSVGSTAPRDRRSRAPSRRAARYTSTPSSTKVRRRTRSSSAPARCRRSSSNRSFRG